MQLRGSFPSALCKRQMHTKLGRFDTIERGEPGQAAIAYWSRRLPLVWGLQFESQARNFDIGLRVYVRL